MNDYSPRTPEELTRIADAVAVMGQAAHDYGPGSPEATGATTALESIYQQKGETR
ncbi:hypothetical protein SCMC78_73860 (plasmid) [Streptomyces sp. CMC78]|uniref:Uncharacterized protein n=1 Tax=Streptomyces sp. CMC78 TaxID=3231512 RepID=A0AB33KW39_9ACTN|nr:hypothetical protein [Streptomyces sp. DE06-01C]MDX5526259.1 hypothetical protein [Streptomyces sp. DE06-01C]